MGNIDKETLIWCAGFFDGEGSICGVRMDKKYTLQVELVNTDMDAIGLFYLIWRGSEYIGKVGIPVAPSSKYVSKSIAKQLRWFDVGAYDILTDLSPYIRVKRQQFQLALEWIGKIRDCKGLRRGKSLLGIEKAYRKWAYYELKVLNHRLDVNPTPKPEIPIRERLL